MFSISARAESESATEAEDIAVIKQSNLTVPALGNTRQGDRPLLLEVSDDHVFGEHPDAQAAPLEIAFPDSPDAADVWARVRLARRLTIPDNEAVTEELRQLREQTLWISKLLYRGTPFVEHVVSALDARYMPLELALLPVIESGYRPHAVSAEKAAGLWQIMPATATEIGVKRTDWFDGRADTVSATSAALDYLSYLNAEFHGDWELTLAAYNAGPGRVRRAIQRNRDAGEPEDFWSLKLPAETRRYVPKLLALVALLQDAKGDLDIPYVPLESSFIAVDVGRRIGVERAAQVAHVPARLLRQLNAGIVFGVTPPGGPHVINLPTESRARFHERLARTGPAPLYHLPHSHEVIAGDTLSGIALQYGVSESHLTTLNKLPDARIRIGQTLAVREKSHADGGSVQHIVSTGDTLSAIASRYGVELHAITDSAGMMLLEETIHPGDELMVHLTPVAGAG